MRVPKNLKFFRSTLLAVGGLTILDNVTKKSEFGRFRSSCASNQSKDVLHSKHSESPRNSRLNYVADAVDIVSPAVVTIGET